MVRLMSDINNTVARLLKKRGRLEEGHAEVRLGTDYRGEQYSSALSYDEARALSEDPYIEAHITPPQFDSDSEFFGKLNNFYQFSEINHPKETMFFGGSLKNTPYIDTVYIAYDQSVDDDRESKRRESRIEEDLVLSFKSLMNREKEDNAGICPFCDPRITISNETFRYPESDDYLIAAPDEFGFREYDSLGKTCRMWWD